MFRRTDNAKGFTIIEVVITIAIGAAVMALVLNAVAGARRSQRNNARAADVNQVAAAVNQYIASRNKLPIKVTDIASILENGDKFGHYAKITCTGTPAVCTSPSINPPKSWDLNVPVVSGDFHDTSGHGMAVASSQTGTVGDTASAAAAAAASDKIVILIKAACSGNEGKVDAGGIREMAIVYRLEGQDDTICIGI